MSDCMLGVQRSLLYIKFKSSIKHRIVCPLMRVFIS